MSNVFKSLSVLYQQKRPKYIQQMAKKITSILFSGRYLAIHWRYNKRDFGKHCDTEKDWRACPIYKFGHSHPEKFAKLIIDKMIEENVSEAYFAAPPDQKDFIENLKLELTKYGKEKVDIKKLSIYQFITFLFYYT